MKIEIFGDQEEAEELARRNKQIADVSPALAKMDAHTLIVAPTGSGKSQLVCALLTTAYLKCFNKVWFITPQWDRDIYKDALDIPEQQVFREYDDDVLDAIVKDIRKRNAKKKKNNLEHDCIVIDDSMEAWQESKHLNYITTHIRHDNISLIVCLQYARGCMKKCARQQMSSVIFFPSNTKPEDAEVLSYLSPSGRDSFAAALKCVRQVGERDGSPYHSLLMSCRNAKTVYWMDIDRPIKIHATDTDDVPGRKARAGTSASAADSEGED